MASAKRSIFNKPAWMSKSTAATVSDDTSVFNRNTVYEDIVAEEQRKRERHAARAKEREEKAKVEKEKLAVKVGGTKRRRISKGVEDKDEDDEINSGSDHDTNSIKSGSRGNSRSPSSSTSPVPVPAGPTTRSSQQKDKKGLVGDSLEPSRSLRSKPHADVHSTQTEAIVLDDEHDQSNQVEDDDLYGAHSKSPPNKSNLKSKPREPDEESEEEDEYMRELKRKAREESRLKQLGARIGKESTPNIGSRPGSIDPRSPSADPSALSQNQVDQPVPDPSDSQVAIRIRTIIPGTKELIVHRFASQTLQKVKEYWCERNGLEPKIASKVFFTWNGTKLFDSTTMHGVIKQLKRIRPMADGSDPSGGKIEIEAMTEEVYQYRQEQKERRRKEAAGIVDSPSPTTQADQQEEADDDDAAAEVAPPASSEPIIILRSSDHGELPIRTKPYATVAKLIAAFRIMQKVPPDIKECYLIYDGERLEDALTCGEMELENEDVIEVHLR